MHKIVPHIGKNIFLTGITYFMLIIIVKEEKPRDMII